MFYSVSKALAWTAAPAAWCTFLLAAAFLLRRRAAVAAALALLATSVPFVFSSPAVAEALQRWAEASALDTSRRGAPYDAVIVLGGDGDGGPRLAGGAEAIRSGRAGRLLYSGVLLPGEPERLRASLRGLGVPDDLVVLEGRSRNTRENALESARVVAERGWGPVLLVTSAAHVDRALSCFRKVGLRPDVLPVGYLSRAPRKGGWRPQSGALGLSTAALHELLGRPVYWAMGYAG